MTIATLSPPRVEEEPEPELEEEAELVGEEGEVPEGEEAAAEGEAPAEGEASAEGGDSGGGELAAVASSPAASRWRAGAARGLGGHRARAGRRPRQPGLALRGHPPQPRLRGGRRAHPALGDAEGEGALSRPDHRGPRRPRGAAGGGSDPPDLHERVGELRRARRAGP